MNYDQELTFAKGIAKKAGNIARGYLPLSTVIKHKADYSPVTEADETINTLVIEEIKKQFPDHAVLGEEESYAPAMRGNLCWVCDPIDGTMPFTLGMSCSTFCLALVRDGVPIVGVVYEFANDRMFYAVKDRGAWLNDTILHVNNDQPMNLIDFEWWDTAPYNLAGVREELFKRHFQVPNYTSGAYTAMMVALARIKGVIHATDKPWDIAAAKVIVEELDVKVTDLYGREQRYDQAIKGAIIAPYKMHEEFLSIIKSINL